MITKTESFKASDGSLHRNLKDAVDHEIAMVIDQAVEDWGADELKHMTSQALAATLTNQPHRAQLEQLFQQLK